MYLVHTVSVVWRLRRQCMHPVHWLAHQETAPGAQWSAPYQCWYASSRLLKPHEETPSQPTHTNRSFRSQLTELVLCDCSRLIAQWLLSGSVTWEFKDCRPGVLTTQGLPLMYLAGISWSDILYCRARWPFLLRTVKAAYAHINCMSINIWHGNCKFLMNPW